eukprot:674277-Amphidinium_carterae.1
MFEGQQVARIQHSRKPLKDKDIRLVKTACGCCEVLPRCQRMLGFAEDARVHNVDIYIPPLTNEQSTPWSALCA